ncbi:MAG: hypothetical protein JXC32_06450 [Anaerolineae bacterium]|nr:hypothetical protein [Anaerolineae bacterium]
MKLSRWMAIVGLVALVALTSACTLEIARNDDGSLSVESQMGEVALESELEAALDGDLIEDLSVDLHTDYILVTAQRRRVTGNEVDDLSFRLDLGAAGGQLTATIYDAEVNGQPIDSARVAHWNGRIAQRLTRAAQRRPNSTLESVSITDEGLSMRWTVATARSRDQ